MRGWRLLEEANRRPNSRALLALESSRANLVWLNPPITAPDTGLLVVAYDRAAGAPPWLVEILEAQP